MSLNGLYSIPNMKIQFGSKPFLNQARILFLSELSNHVSWIVSYLPNILKTYCLDIRFSKFPKLCTIQEQLELLYDGGLLARWNGNNQLPQCQQRRGDNSVVLALPFFWLGRTKRRKITVYSQYIIPNRVIELNETFFYF